MTGPENAPKNKSSSTSGRVKKFASKLDYLIASVDFGPVKIDCILKPKASGKVKVSLGPEYSYNHVKLFPADMNLGWLEDTFYQLAKSYLPSFATVKEPKVLRGI